MQTPSKATAHRQPYRWLGAAALTLGCGAAMLAGSGAAQADSRDSSVKAPGPAAPARHASPHSAPAAARPTAAAQPAAAVASLSPPPGPGYLYVANFTTAGLKPGKGNKTPGIVSVIDTTNSIVSTNISAGGRRNLIQAPFQVAASSQYVYATTANGKVIVINPNTDTVVKTITGFQDAWGVAVSPNGGTAYVTNNEIKRAPAGGLFGGPLDPGRGPDNRVSVIDAATNTVTGTITVGYGPKGIAASPDGNAIYVANSCDSRKSCSATTGSLSVIDTNPNDGTAVNTVIHTLTFDSQAIAVAVSPNSQAAYVTTNGGTGPTGTVKVIDTANATVTKTISVGVNPTAVVVTADGSTAFVANFGSNTVSVIDTATGTVTDTIEDISNPNGLALVGSYLYVTNTNGGPSHQYQGTVTVIPTVNTASKGPDNQYTVLGTIGVGNDPIGIAAWT